MDRRFVAIGECMVELAQTGDDDLFRMGFAGDTYNAAWYARRLLPCDWAVDYATCLGDDPVSDRMAAAIDGAGIGTGAIRRIEGSAPGLYMIQLDAGERSFAYWRGQSAARRLAEDAAWLDATLSGAGMVLFSGITLAILDPAGRQRLCAALARARAAGSTVAFDTNQRPRLWEGPQAMRDGLALGAAVSDVVLPSFDEEQALFGDTDPAATAARYRAAGAGLVAVKNGAGPMHLSGAGGDEVLTPVAAPRVVDTTAAGDSFDAGMLSALAAGLAPRDAVRRGMALAARVIGGHGALVDGAWHDL